MPKSGNKVKIRGHYWNVISHVMNGNRINVIALNMDQLADLRLNLEMNLYFAPYIMSIIKAKISFRGICDCKHTPFRPFKNDTAFLLRPLTPFPGDDMDEGVHGQDDDGDSDDDAHMGAAAAQHSMPCHLHSLQCSSSGLHQLATLILILHPCSRACLLR